MFVGIKPLVAFKELGRLFQLLGAIYKSVFVFDWFYAKVDLARAKMFYC